MLLPAAMVLLISAHAPRAAARAEFLVIVQAANPVQSLTVEDVSRMFLKKVTRWEDGHSVLPVDQAEDSPVRAAFSRDVLRRKLAAVRAYWQQRIFSGRDVPPPVRTSDAEVIRYVEANAGAIGYVAGGTALGDKVRAIALPGADR
jgi:ABC-type phosphate transport system substrate-binding protein